ncbi:MAG TPA: MFS transporter, partial [Marmoricola sp.]|nr:MFS transporter [Marmoricola sp.]
MNSQTQSKAPQQATSPGNPWVMLILATIGFAVNFWAWALISPLGPLFRVQGRLGELTEGDVALMVAVPVVVGSLGRIIVGALTDRYGGRIMFPLISLITIVPVLFLAFFALDSYTLILIGGFFLGIAGTAFAVGVPFVNSWFPPAKRGLAIGIFGAGMGGTAISALTTVNLFTNQGEKSPFLITSAVLAIYAVVSWLVLRDAPGRVVPTNSLGARIKSAATQPVTWQAAILYAVSFGGYVAFSVYLPAFLRNSYDLTPADAA